MEPVFWLGHQAPVAEIGLLALVFAKLAAQGLPIPSGFVLGRSHFEKYAARMSNLPVETYGDYRVSLPEDIHRVVESALASLSGPAAVRRSPFTWQRSDPWEHGRSGRPERETFLNLPSATDVLEAVRRIWARTTTGPLAIIVQSFVPSEICVLMKPDPAHPEVLQIKSTFGVGDLLAAGLVVPDQDTVRLRDGKIVHRRVGRKTQMSVAKPEGGMTRVPVPTQKASQVTITEAVLAELAALWRDSDAAAGPLASLSVSLSGADRTVTNAIPAFSAPQD